MILTTYAVLSVLGLVVFFGGMVIGRPDIAFIGAIFVMGTGAIAASSGLEVPAGSETVEYENEDNETVTNETTVYEPIADHSSFPVEIMTVLVGALFGFAAAGRMSEL